ncbi:methylated-DNA--protein-cysteine methyltransferase isoform X2 [Salminus brasiliensis]|uniref:methylated-DNA--protein-cysteine methyltransferase isoform X2 n=1 Tax=Salminus brasiliensis TaxID=930266 RepID=UPI003B82C922
MIKHSSKCVLQSVFLQSPIGQLQLSGCEKGIHTVTITKETEHSAVTCDDGGVCAELQRCVSWLQSYFSSAQSVTSLPPPPIHHPLLQTDSFSACVLRILQDQVPVGRTVSYRQLAEMAGNVQAVPLLIPCHRVLCSSGAIGGFMGGKGTEMKLWLLQHEGWEPQLRTADGN